jgi:putative Mn2+ efflux pump MntP
VSVALSLLGLEIGSRVGARLERRGQLLGGAVLIGLGLALAAGLA